MIIIYTLQSIIIKGKSNILRDYISGIVTVSFDENRQRHCESEISKKKAVEFDVSAEVKESNYATIYIWSSN